MNYYISDLHLFCDSQLKKYDKRPFENIEQMHDYIKKQWNRKVTNADTVYILGDISMRGRSEALIAFMSVLKGKKILVKGNHDDLSDYRLKQVFYDVCDYKELGDSYNGKNHKVVMSHYPILMWNGQHRGVILLYGHTHITAEDDYFQKCLKKMNENPEFKREGDKDIIAINVGCMQPYMNYEPKSLKELLVALGYEKE